MTLARRSTSWIPVLLVLIALLPPALASCARSGARPAVTAKDPKAGPPAPVEVRGPLPVLEPAPRPAVTPGYTELDTSTGLHMTGTPQEIDAATWRLAVTGKVRNPLSLAYDELRRLPRLETKDPIICSGFFEDYARWAGASLSSLLDKAGVEEGARNLALVAADGYTTSVSLAEALSGYALIVYEWEGKSLPVLHGYPARAAFPGLDGNKWVKWLVEIRVE